MPKTFNIQPVAAYTPEKPRDDGSGIFVHCSDNVMTAFRNTLQGSQILGAEFVNPYTGKTESIPDDVNDLDARHLQILARNEHVNVDGIMNTRLYNNLLTDDQIARIRCLVKATHVTGIVYATHTGGYRHKRYKFDEPVQNILIDQAGLQWQGDYRNTGGMHFFPDNPQHDLLPDNYQTWQKDMYEAMYDMKRPDAPSSNSLDVSWYGVTGKLDLNAVSMALAIEFRQALESAVFQGQVDLNDTARINFRFCRAGMGFFVSGLQCDLSTLRVARLHGIKMALSQIAELPDEERSEALGKIGRIVLPHSNEAPHSDDVLNEIGHIVNELGLVWGGAPEEDNFKPEEGYVNATTNCADPHAMPGNEGGPSSVDACVSYNANINNHNATFNHNMQVRTAPQFHFDTNKHIVKLTSQVSRQSIFLQKEVPSESESSATQPKAGPSAKKI